MDAVIECYPSAARVFDAVNSDRLSGVDIVQLHGPAGCLKRDVAALGLGMLGLPEISIGWMDLRMRSDKVLNTLLAPRCDGRKRGVVVSVHDGFVQRERLLGLLEYTAHNFFVVCATEKLSLPSVDFGMYPLPLNDLEVMLKRLSKKCEWSYHKDMLDPVYRYTDGVPAKIVHLIRACQSAKTPARVVKMIEDRKESRIADTLYTALTGAKVPYTEVAKSINDALQQASWVELAERLQEYLRRDILSGVSMSEHALSDGMWSILEDFDPTSKNKFISGCFKIAAVARRV